MSDRPPLTSGTIYTETVVHSAPEALVNEAPYQIAIVELDSGSRVTGRIEDDRVSIGDRVSFSGFRNEVPFFRKSS